jgi:orotidine-5'-phosphate decarboxylase
MNQPNKKIPGIIVALDFPSLEKVPSVIEELAPYAAGFKVGMELCTAVGAPTAVETVHRYGGKVFLDLKYGDIPNTVKGAVKVAADLGVWLANAHATFDTAALEEAAKVKGETKVVAVTVLTSMKEERCRHLYGRGVSEMTELFTKEALAAGLDGVVCRPGEVPNLRRACTGSAFITVNPGIRPLWAETGDQEKPITPADAAGLGCDYFVLGRPVVKPPGGMSRAEAIQKVLEEMENAIA